MFRRLVGATIFVTLGWGQLCLGLSLAVVPVNDLTRCPFHKLVSYADQTTALKEEHLHYFEYPKDNKGFIKRWKHVPPQKNVVFFHVENAVLKLLNDKVLEDKQASAALLNLYKRIFYEEVKKRPKFDKMIIDTDDAGSYSDFKIIRGASEIKSRAQIEQFLRDIDEIHTSAALRFEHEVRSYPLLYAKLKGRVDLSGSPSLHHQMGVGLTPEQASYKAKKGRKATTVVVDDDVRLIRVQVFGKGDAENVVRDIEAIEKLRRSLPEFTFVPANMRIYDSRTGLLSRAALEIFKAAKNDPSLKTRADYVQRIQRDFWMRFGVKVDPGDVLRFQEYLHTVEDLVPSLYIEEDEPIHLAQMEGATHGVLSFDLEGAGIGNTLQTMRVLKKMAEEPKGRDPIKQANRILKELRKGQDIASTQFLERRKRIEAVLTRLGLLKDGSRLTMSGDDVIFLPSEEVTPELHSRLTSELRKERAKGLKVRHTFQPQQYSKSKTDVDSEGRFEIVSRLELIQKRLSMDLRRQAPELWRNGTFDDLQIGITTTPVDPTHMEIRVVLDHETGKTSLRTKAIVKQAVEKVLRSSLKSGSGIELKEVLFDDEVSNQRRVLIPVGLGR